MILNTLYKALLKQLITDHNIGLQHLDKFNDQLEFEEDEIPFDLPACFIELPAEVPWRSVGRHKMIGTCDFNVILVIETYLDTDSNAPEDERNDALIPENLVNDITQLLVGFSGEGFGTISRTGTIQDATYSNLKEIVIPFKTLLTDLSAKRVVTKKQVSHTFTVEVKDEEE